MQSLSSHLSQTWLTKLPQDLQDLIITSIKLAEREQLATNSLPDYSFVVFPMAKAYEGFLKIYLLKKGFINQETYSSHRFRIGRALNPDLREYYRDSQWLYDDLTNSCGGETAREVWETWLKCRNRVFHFFPGELSALSIDQAQDYITSMIEVIKKMMSCLSENNK